MNKEEEELLLHYLPLIRNYCRKYKNRVSILDHDDFVNESIFYVLKAIRSFNPELGVPLGAHILKWVRSSCSNLQKKYRKAVSYELLVEPSIGPNWEALDIQLLHDCVNACDDDEILLINHIFGLNAYEKLSISKYAKLNNVSRDVISRRKAKILTKLNKFYTQGIPANPRNELFFINE